MRGLLIALAMLFASDHGVNAQDASARERVIKGMMSGYEESASAVPGAPNLMELLKTRFPDDTNALADEVLAKAGQADRNALRMMVAGAFVRIQARDGEKLKAAPGASLRAVLEAERGLFQALEPAAPELCKTLISGGGPAQKAATPDIARASLVRLDALLNAIADGRDNPVNARQPPADADYRLLALDARKKGVDTDQWRPLAPDRIAAAPPASICRAMVSVLGAEMAFDGEVGERLMAANAASLLQHSTKPYEEMAK